MSKPIIRVTVEVRSDEGYLGQPLAEVSFDTEVDVEPSVIREQTATAYMTLTGFASVQSAIAAADLERGAIISDGPVSITSSGKDLRVENNTFAAPGVRIGLVEPSDVDPA